MTNHFTPSKRSHVPGPYFYERNTNGVDDEWLIRVLAADQHYVATITFWEEPDTDEATITEANARLLTASPEMFEALAEMVEALNGKNVTVECPKVFRAVRSARHALALADGTLSYRAC